MAPRMKTPVTRGKDTGSEKESSRKDRSDRLKRGKPERAKTAAVKTVKGRRRVDKSKAKGRLGKATQEKLKGWLATPADWARFNAWAEINAQPRKIPEPEPIVRLSKPLSKLKKRIKVLSEPRKVVDPSIHCRLDTSISKAALEAVPSVRTNLLALPIIRLVDYGRVFYQISPAALKYVPSRRIIALSQPHSTRPEECKPPLLRACRPPLDRERLKELAMKRKLLHCPEQLTKEELEELFTPRGIRRTALTYQITPWVEFLSLPPYKMIKERKDEQAVSWKKAIINDGEQRAKDAWVEHLKRREKEIKKERMKRMLRRKLCEEEKQKKEQKEKEEREKRRKRWHKDKSKECEDIEYEVRETKEREGKEKIKDKKRTKRKKQTRDDGDAKEVADREGEEKISKEEEEKRKLDEKKKEKKRKKRKHAWRFAPHPCKDDPYLIKKSTLEFEATPRMTELSEPRVYKNRVTRANPFAVKKAALSATASGRVEDLAKPTRPRSPVERKPPREKDAYGKPIFVMPVYGKILPKTKPYKMGECPTDEEKKKKKKVTKRRPIDPIVYEPTYDPCISPDLARKQKKERKRAAKLFPKMKSRRRKMGQTKQASKVSVREVEEKDEEEEEEEEE